MKVNRHLQYCYNCGKTCEHIRKNERLRRCKICGAEKMVIYPD